MISERWKRSYDKLLSAGGGGSSQIKVKDSFASTTISEEESNEMEIEAYYQQLKSKTSVKNLWDGKKFLDLVDGDVTPEVSTDSESQLEIKMSSTLKNLRQIELDSDEDEMRMDYIRENTVDENNNVEESSDDDVNLMNNIHFAELELSEVNLSDDGIKKSKPNDFLPRLYSVDKVEVSASSDSSSFNYDDYRGLSKLESENSKNNPVFRSRSKSDDLTDESVEDIGEELSEIQSVKSDYSGRVSDKTASERSQSKSNNSKRSSSKSYSNRSNSTHKSKQTHSSYSSDNSSRSSNHTLSASDGRDLHSDDRSSYVSRTSVSHTRSKRTPRRSKTNSSKDSSVASSKVSDTENEKSTRKEKKKRTKNESLSHAQTQTRAFINDDQTEDVLKFRHDWQRTEPSNIAAHVLDPVTIDVLTNYNPSVLAANDLMKYHLQLMQQHIEDSRRLYEAYANENMNNNYKYTTVEDTKKYIEKNAPKVISFEEALKLAKAEEEFR